VIDASLKTPDGKEALNPDGLVPRVVRALKQEFPDLGVMTDVALDPFTSHGQDGLLDDTGYILNDETVEVLVPPGADPGRRRRGHRRAQRHDGRPHRRHPRALEAHGPHPHAHHGLQRQVRQRLLRPVPRRRGLGRQPGQEQQEGLPDGPGNSDEALREVALDIAEGADMVMVKPGMPYLDIVRRVKDEFRVPTFAYQVSGEYAMLKAAAQNGWLDHDAVMMESLLAFKRAGADGVLTYFRRPAGGGTGRTVALGGAGRSHGQPGHGRRGKPLPATPQQL
jgi:porphobilinogen synthase